MIESEAVHLGSHSYGPEATVADRRGARNSHYDLLGSILGRASRRSRHFPWHRQGPSDNSFVEFPNDEKDGVVPGGSIWDTAKFGEDVIIGNLDTGVWPSSESFDDTWFGAIPSRWKGICQQGYGPKFPCNRSLTRISHDSELVYRTRKLIGARYFYKGFAFRSGKFNETKRHSFDDDGHGSHTLSTAGGNFVPKAGVFGSGNGTARGGPPKARVAHTKFVGLQKKTPKDYFNHGLSIGAFHAAKRGIVVVCAAGNNGPTPRTVVNVAPWIITVGASTMDREFQSNNGQNLKGASLSPALPEEKMYPLLSAALGKAANASENDADPTGYITPPETQLYTKPAPFMAAFSSRGPNSITPTILKPDITAPGVNIIASWTGAISQTDQVFQTGRNKYYADSGTSMACPHVAGIAGLLKSLHPDWSPAAIRSAMMATARTKDNTGGPMIDATQEKARPFGYGAGHIRPNRAQDPGLVYDLTTDDYLNFLCSLGYNQTQIGAFSEKKTSFKCSPGFDILNLNYPSITSEMTVSRTLKNVGEPGTYTARIRQPVRVGATVEPKTLQFEKHGEEKTFTLIFNATPGTITDIVFGELLWKDGVHYVRSPIVVG
ncbi:hypothetical protein Leryth_007195 [Lithospermum erythrorhizon]|nr:hypothetical protein Leryth_007195 [Lithospermum erythrorhizon]